MDANCHKFIQLGRDNCSCRLKAFLGQQKGGGWISNIHLNTSLCVTNLVNKFLDIEMRFKKAKGRKHKIKISPLTYQVRAELQVV